MANGFLGLNAGGGMVLVFKDGHTETISMSKVHIEPDGINELPENCYPIVVSTKTVQHGAAWAQDAVSISFGTDDDNTTLVSAKASGTVGSLAAVGSKYYLPACVNSLEKLKHGVLRYSSNTVGSEWFYVYAEKE